MVRLISTLGQSYDLHDIRLIQKEALLEGKHLTVGMPFLTPNHSFKTGGPKAFNDATIFKKCSETISSAGQELHILKTNQMLDLPNIFNNTKEKMTHVLCHDLLLKLPILIYIHISCKRVHHFIQMSNIQ